MMKTVYVLPKELEVARSIAVGLKSEGKPEYLNGIEQIAFTFRYQRDAKRFASALPMAVHHRLINWIHGGAK